MLRRKSEQKKPIHFKCLQFLEMFQTFNMKENIQYKSQNIVLISLRFVKIACFAILPF